jgi:LPXTG-motif cell wall-anchored protein
MYTKAGLVTPAAAGAGWAGGQLPYTGGDPIALALVGLGLLVAGFTILFALRALRNLAPMRR